MVDGNQYAAVAGWNRNGLFVLGDVQRVVVTFVMVRVSMTSMTVTVTTVTVTVTCVT